MLNKFGKATGQKVNMQNSSAFLYSSNNVNKKFSEINPTKPVQDLYTKNKTSLNEIKDNIHGGINHIFNLEYYKNVNSPNCSREPKHPNQNSSIFFA